MKLPLKFAASIFAGCLSFSCSLFAQANGEVPMKIWETCTKVKILSKVELCGTNEECLNNDNFITEATVYTKSQDTFEWRGGTYTIFLEADGEVIPDSTEVEITGSYELGVDQWAIDHSDSRPPEITDLSLVFLPIGDGKFIINQAASDCISE